MLRHVNEDHIVPELQLLERLPRLMIAAEAETMDGQRCLATRSSVGNSLCGLAARKWRENSRQSEYVVMPRWQLSTSPEFCAGSQLRGVLVRVQSIRAEGRARHPRRLRLDIYGSGQHDKIFISHTLAAELIFLQI